MNNIKSTQYEELKILQILDANLDRAREGLRVLEDWSRFALGREDLVKKTKDFRQILGKEHSLLYKNARNLSEDKCIGLNHPEQLKRKGSDLIISSNAARVQEALRVIEEFSRSSNQKLSQIASDIRYEIYNLEIEILNANAKSEKTQIIQKNNLYFITKKTPKLIEIIEELLIGGVKIIQHRSKGESDKKFLFESIQICKLCRKYNALFIVNDRVDIAIASEADGVHLGQNDIDLKYARDLLGNSKIIGKSANNSIEINKAIDEGCDYLGIGPVFRTSTKKEKNPIGISRIIALTKNISIPWFAIGGINQTNLSTLQDHKIKKIAIISGLADSANPKKEAIIISKKLSDANSR